MSQDQKIDRMSNFSRIYRKRIQPTLIRFEQERIRLKVLSIVVFCIIAVLILWYPIVHLLSHLGFSYPIFVDSDFQISLFGLSIIISIYLYRFVLGECKSFRDDLKNNCLGDVLSVFENLNWNSGVDIIPDEDVQRSSLFIDYASRKSDDGFVGEYKGVKFRISETILWGCQNPERSKYPHKIFQGVLIDFIFNKPIKSKTIVATKFDFTAKNNLLVSLFSLLLSVILLFNWNCVDVTERTEYIVVICFCLFHVFRDLIFAEKFELVKLEDVRFGNRFNVYSADQVEARYLVTPSFMKRFYDMKTAFGARKAKCSFYNNKLMIAIATKKDLFEVGGVSRSLYNPQGMGDFYNELSTVYKLIDTFKLDEKTGL